MATAICKTPLRSTERASSGPKSAGFCGSFGCTSKGYGERETSLTPFQGSLCSPHKSTGFCGSFGCTSKGYGERETSLTLLERERAVFQGSLCSPLKSGGFCCNFGCTSKGYGERELFFRACYARLSKVVVFDAFLGAPVRGMERGSCFSGLAMLASQKWWFLMHFWVHQ